MDKAEYYLSLIRGARNRSYAENADLLIVKVSYNGDGSVEYYGLAPQGSATSAAVWRIEKLAYDGSGNYTGSTYSAANQVWDDRASISYS